MTAQPGRGSATLLTARGGAMAEKASDMATAGSESHVPRVSTKAVAEATPTKKLWESAGRGRLSPRRSARPQIQQLAFRRGWGDGSP